MTSVEAQSPGASRPRVGALLTPDVAVLTVLMTVAFVMFVAIEPTPRWLALLTAVVGAMGTDGVLRSARREVFEGGGETTPYLFLPALFAFTAPVFAEYNASGYWGIVVALGAGLAFGVVVIAEVGTVPVGLRADGREEGSLRGVARFLAASATYFVAFALYSLVYAFDVPLAAAVVAVTLMSVLLAVELLRDGEIDPIETLVFAGVVGVVVGEARWALQFLPLDGYLAGLALLLLFYFMTGVAHAYITRSLGLRVAVEYGVVAAVGVVLVVGARAAGIA
jgi:hypothetical protein